MGHEWVKLYQRRCVTGHPLPALLSILTVGPVNVGDSESDMKIELNTSSSSTCWLRFLLVVQYSLCLFNYFTSIWAGPAQHIAGSAPVS